MADTVSSANLTLEGARRVLDGALARAGEKGQAFCIAITDSAGDPILAVRMDGAPRLSAGIAADKAYTVAGFGGTPTGDWWGMISDEPSLVHGITHTPRLVIFGGGVPIRSAGQLVGAIGVSGGSADDDTEVATAGAAVIT